MRINLSLQQLEAVVRIAEAGSFRAAARQLDISQPALSRTLRLAEETLGMRLFDRDTRHVSITPAGEELLHIARRVLRDFDSALGELGHFMQGHRGRITVAALPSISVALLPQAIAGFRREYPEVEFRLLELPAEPLLAAIEDGHADFGLCTKPAQDQRLKYQHLCNDPMMLLCRAGDPLAASNSLPWSAFMGRDYLTVQAGSSIRSIVDPVFIRKRLQVQPVMETASVAACCALVKAGFGVTALPRFALGLADMQDLVAVPLSQPAVSRPIGLVTRIGRSLSPASQRFIDRMSRQD
ncbi:LysR family transcriptional regulator [Comamonas composti]|uniref:LysR family transcriptional regulator n=1 Tax=Comamonas composti TaxID=408558 RepID=UPI0003FCA3D9|nr:LysR family transcriptional regulator [Comamonas composti]